MQQATFQYEDRICYYHYNAVPAAASTQWSRINCNLENIRQQNTSLNLFKQ